MRKASFKVVNANANSTAHNDRTNSPRYLVPPSSKNYYELKYSDTEFLKVAELDYNLTHRRAMQERQKVALIKETVLNLEKHHTEKDVKDLFKKLNEKYGGHYVIELSIHNDEGHFEKDGIAYYPTKHIMQKDDDWYIVPLSKFLDDDFKPTKNDFTDKVNIDDFKIVYNKHAHVKFSMYDLDNHTTGRMQKGHMQSRLKFVAKELGLAYKPEEKISSGKAINHIKDEHDLNRRSQIKQLFLNKKLNKQTAKKEELKVEKKELKATTKDLQLNIKQLRKELSGQGLSKKDFARVNELNKKLKEQIKSKDLNIDDLELRLKKVKEELLQTKDKKQSFQEALKQIKPDAKNNTEVVAYVSEIKKELRDTRETVLTLSEVNELLKSDLSDSRQSISELKQKFDELEKNFESKLAEKINEYKKEKEEPVVTNQEFLEAAAKVAKRNKKQTNSQEQIR